MKKVIFILLGLFFINGLNAQNLQEGYTYLENGNYEKAAQYFTAVLKEFPNNKSAQLCYGRAIGLQGRAEEAEAIFKALITNDPQNLEFQLNYAEALLWNKKFAEAKLYYEQLLPKNATNFLVNLGYANTLSNLKEYTAASIYITKALAIQPNNYSALQSKKYIKLGYANALQQEQKYTQAEAVLLENISFLNYDLETYQSLANLYLITNNLNKAEAVFHKIEEKPEHLDTAKQGLALVVHLKGKNKKALQLISEHFKSSETPSFKTTERYIQALLWNRKFKAAKTNIEIAKSKYTNENELLLLEANYAMYTYNYQESIAKYNQILKKDSTSFDANLGKANALKALKNYKEAYAYTNKTLSFYKHQKDATNLANELQTRFTPYIETTSNTNKDNGNNAAFSIGNNAAFPISTKIKILGNYNYRETQNSTLQQNAKSHAFSLGLNYQISTKVSVQSGLGTIRATTNAHSYSQITTHNELAIQTGKLQHLKMGYVRELQNFNADLLQRELTMNTFFTNYSLSTLTGFGWYNSYRYTWQNDNNTRNLFFTSVYYNLNQNPLFKAGVNYQYIRFKKQLPMVYFSPKKFQAVELFLNVIKDDANSSAKSWFYNATAAFGYQFIASEKKQATYRLEGKLGYKFSNRWYLNLYGKHSNIASVTVAGFTFTEFGFGLKWHFLNRPIFAL